MISKHGNKVLSANLLFDAKATQCFLKIWFKSKLTGTFYTWLEHSNSPNPSTPLIPAVWYIPVGWEVPPRWCKTL